MKCPGCGDTVLPLKERPMPLSISGATTLQVTGEDMGGSTFSMVEEPTHEVYKCCNEKCWVTKIEVDWG